MNYTEFLQNKTNSDLNRLIIELDATKNKRNADFTSAIKNNDVKTFLELIPFIDTKKQKLWDDLVNIRIQNLNTEMINQIFTEKENNFKILRDDLISWKLSGTPSLTNDLRDFFNDSDNPKNTTSENKEKHISFKETSQISALGLMRAVFRKKINMAALYGPINEAIFDAQLNYNQNLLNYANCEKIAQSLANIDFKSFKEKTFNFLKEYNQQINFFIFLKEENLDCFIGEKANNVALINEVNINGDNLVERVIINGGVEKLKLLLDYGAKIVENKAMFSQVFCQTKDSSWKMKEFIVDEIDDITTKGSQVILKSTLHNKYNFDTLVRAKDLTMRILNRYKNEEMHLLPASIHKREESDLTLMVKKFITYHKVESALPKKEENTKSFKI